MISMQQQKSTSKFSRIDYVQVGLTSKNAFKSVRRTGQQVEVVIGDHSGSLHLFILRTDSNQIETVFTTLPGKHSLQKHKYHLLLVKFLD